MREPTESEVKKFWEWCGWIDRGITNSATHGLVYAPRQTWWFPKGNGYEDKHHKMTNISYDESFGLPPLDLNNLFKYAVPKLMTIQNFHLLNYQFLGNGFAMNDDWSRHIFTIHFTDERDSIDVGDDTPALALFWAIYEVVDPVRQKGETK